MKLILKFQTKYLSNTKIVIKIQKMFHLVILFLIENCAKYFFLMTKNFKNNYTKINELELIHL